MDRQFVNSSNIRSIGYNNGTLEIEFNHGGIYQYLNVPHHTYNQLMCASSHGQYFHRFVKDCYPTIKIL